MPYLVAERLQGKRDAFGHVILLLGGHVVDSLPEEVDVVQELQQRVHVASGALILEPHKPCLGFTVVKGIFRLVHHHLCPDLHCTNPKSVHFTKVLVRYGYREVADANMESGSSQVLP